ncbi:MAG: hypothetical protein LC790_15115 [Actinobacteria bacterium]|nr:hypothetical protein [Actinomycetota bacterium]
MVTRKEAQSSGLHGANSHDLIRVQGARVNNVKDVSVEIPKRRRTVFTGVSGSGKRVSRSFLSYAESRADAVVFSRTAADVW